MTVPYSDIDTIFLDAGNTIVHMDHGFLSGGFELAGFPMEPGVLARVEAACRMELSAFLATGRATETRETRRYWMELVLRRVGERTGRAPAAGNRESLLEWLESPDVRGRTWTFVPDFVAPALARLRDAGYKIIVISNSDGTIEDGLTKVGLRQFVDAVVDSGKLGIEKPHPAIFRRALDLAASDPENCLHAGDLYAIDVAGARSVGIHPVLIDPFDDHHTADCERVRDIAQLVERLLAGR